MFRPALVPILSLVVCSAAMAEPERVKVMPPAGSSTGSMLTLEHAYDIAAASDQALKIAFYRVRQAELLPLSALTKVAPRFSGSTGYGRGYTHDRMGSNNQHYGTATADLTVQQPLLDVSVFPARRKGKLAVEASRLGRQFTIRETLFGVATAYFAVLKGERVVAVKKQSLSLAQEQQSLSQKRADVGEVTRSDVLRAQVSVETARLELITSENALELQRNTLRNILNLPPDAPLRLAEPLPYRRDVPEFGPLLAKAYENREDLRERGLVVTQSEEHRREVRAQYAPRIVAQGGPGLSRTSNGGPSGGKAAGEWQAGVSVEFPFFTGGQRELDIVGAGYDIETARLEQERLGKVVESEVKEAWLKVQLLEGQLRAVRVQVQAAEQGYKDLQNQYSAGTAKSVDVLSALKDLSQARSDLATLSLDYQVALRNLEQVSGTFQEQRVRALSGK